MASDASKLSSTRNLSEAERWKIVEKLLGLRDSERTNLLQPGALTKVSDETGVSRQSVSDIWRSFRWTSDGTPDVSGNPDVSRKAREKQQKKGVEGEAAASGGLLLEQAGEQEKEDVDFDEYDGEEGYEEEEEYDLEAEAEYYSEVEYPSPGAIPAVAMFEGQGVPEEAAEAAPGTANHLLASKLSFNGYGEAVRWRIVEKLLALRDSEKKNLLKRGAVKRVSRETGVSWEAVSNIWRNFCWKTAVSGKPDVSRNKGGGRKPKFSPEELRRRIREVPVADRSSIPKIAKKAGLPVNQVQRAIRLGVLKTPKDLHHAMAGEKQQKKGVEGDASAQAGLLLSKGEHQEGQDSEFDIVEYDGEEDYEEDEAYDLEAEVESEGAEYSSPGAISAVETSTPLQQKSLTYSIHSMVEAWTQPLPTEALAAAPAVQEKQAARLGNTQTTAFTGTPDRFERQGFSAPAAAPGTAPGEGRRATAGGFLNLRRQQAGVANPAVAHRVRHRGAHIDHTHAQESLAHISLTQQGQQEEVHDLAWEPLELGTS